MDDVYQVPAGPPGGGFDRVGRVRSIGTTDETGTGGQNVAPASAVPRGVKSASTCHHSIGVATTGGPSAPGLLVPPSQPSEGVG